MDERTLYAVVEIAFPIYGGEAASNAEERLFDMLFSHDEIDFWVRSVREG